MGSLLKKIRSKRKHGLLLHSILHMFGRKGIRIYPYYLIKEKTDVANLPAIRGNIEEYASDFLDSRDLDTLEQNDEFKGKKAEFQKRLDKGNKCVCLKHQGQIVAHSWFHLEECRFIDSLFELNEDEAYLFDMYTLKSYRGKNIAPFLRYKSYEALKNMGRDSLYSISEIFNAPAVKFKKKLNAEFLGSYLLIDLFRKWKWNLRIKGDKIRKKS